MSWARLDDGIFANRKLVALGSGTTGAVRRETWIRIICHTAAQGSAEVSPHIREVIQRATPGYLRDCVTIGLLDQDQDGTMHVHDWLLYADVPIRDKVIYYLGRFPTASANEVVKGINGGTRDIVLKEVARYHQEQGGSVEPHPNQYVRTTKPGSESGSRTPDSRPEVKSKALPTTGLDIHAPELVVATPDLEHPDDQATLVELLDQIGVHDGLRVAAFQDVPRAIAWALKAREAATSSPAGFFRSTFETGRWPAPPEPVRAAPIPPCVSCGVGGGLHLAECLLVGSVPPDNESEADAA